MLAPVIDSPLVRLLTALLFSMFLVAGVFSLSSRPAVRLLVGALALGGIVLRWLRLAMPTPAIIGWGFALPLLFMIFLTLANIRKVFCDDEAVTGARVTGAVAVYLLFGLTYMVYGTFIVATMVDEYHFGEATAGSFWSWTGFFCLFSGVGFGILSDRLGRRGGLMLAYGVQGAAYLLVASQLGTLALFGSVALYGLAVFAVPAIIAARTIASPRERLTNGQIGFPA